MNYYLTPREIAEALSLTDLRKSTPTGMYLLSESDLVPYGVERAKQAGAIELSNNRHVTPAQETVEEPDNGQQTVDTPAEEESGQQENQESEREPAQEGDATQEENEETETLEDAAPEQEDAGSSAGDEEPEEDNSNNENIEEE